MFSIAFDKASIMLSGLGSANDAISSGNTSEIAPTLVDTTYNPEAAASTIAMQKASVKDVFMNICPLTNTFLTSL